MSQESSLRQARFTLVEGCDEFQVTRWDSLTLGPEKRREEGLGWWLRVEGNADRNLAFPRNVRVD